MIGPMKKQRDKWHLKVQEARGDATGASGLRLLPLVRFMTGSESGDRVIGSSGHRVIGNSKRAHFMAVGMTKELFQVLCDLRIGVGTRSTEGNSSRAKAQTYSNFSARLKSCAVTRLVTLYAIYKEIDGVSFGTR